MSDREQASSEYAKAGQTRRFVTCTVVTEPSGRKTAHYSLTASGRMLAFLSLGTISSLGAVLAIGFHLLTIALLPAIGAEAREVSRREMQTELDEKRVVPYASFQAHLRERVAADMQGMKQFEAITKRLDTIDARQEKIYEMLITQRIREIPRKESWPWNSKGADDPNHGSGN